jgi:hypothetical protein
MADVRFAFPARNNTWRARETYHALASGITSECGRDASSWLRIADVSLSSALDDANFCVRCKSKLRRRFRVANIIQARRDAALEQRSIEAAPGEDE